MTQITIRGIAPEIDKKIRKKALKSGKSLNRVVLDLLEKNTGAEKKRAPKAATLKQLAGGWNKADASRFMDSIKAFEQIDEAMWK